MIVAYSVLHHQLLDVHVTLSRYAAHFIRFAFPLLHRHGAAPLCRRLAFTGAFDAFSFILALGVFLIAPDPDRRPSFRGSSGHRGGFEKWERRILGDRFEYQDQVRNFIANMTWYDDLAGLARRTRRIPQQTFRFGSYQIILRDETTRAFTLFRALSRRAAAPASRI